jgi:membrane protein YdbS with pleckstrin-like domain
MVQPQDPAGDDPADTGRHETDAEQADRNWVEIIQELRVAQTGTQILSGFLLAVAFQPTFAGLAPYQHVVYLILVLLAASTTTVGLIPVSLHRRSFRRHEKPRLVTQGDRLVKIELTLVSVLTAGVVFFLFDVTVGLGVAVPVAAVMVVGMLLALLVYPLRSMRTRGGPTS